MSRSKQPHDRGARSANATSSSVAVLLANHRRFLSFLERRVKRREDAEEILQAAFVKSLEKGDTLEQAESVVAWFYRLLRNALIDHYRRQAAADRAVKKRAAQAGGAEASWEPELEREVCACVNGLLPLLKPADADLLRRVDLGGASIGTVTTELGIQPGAARVRLHRARAELRRALERSCRTCAEHGCLDCTCAAGPSA